MAVYKISVGSGYDGTGTVKASLVLHKDYEVLTTAVNATLSMYRQDGQLLHAFGTVSLPDSNGSFAFDDASKELNGDALYYFVATVTDGSDLVSEMIFRWNQ